MSDVPQTALVSIPKRARKAFALKRPQLLAALGMIGNPESFSKLVWHTVTRGTVMTTAELQEFVAKEAHTNRDKYLVVIW